jgi:hypothetical protein
VGEHLGSASNGRSAIARTAPSGKAASPKVQALRADLSLTLRHKQLFSAQAACPPPLPTAPTTWRSRRAGSHQRVSDDRPRAGPALLSHAARTGTRRLAAHYVNLFRQAPAARAATANSPTAAAVIARAQPARRPVERRRPAPTAGLARSALSRECGTSPAAPLPQLRLFAAGSARAGRGPRRRWRSSPLLLLGMQAPSAPDARRARRTGRRGRLTPFRGGPVLASANARAVAPG